MMMELLAVVIAGVCGFMLGGIWYAKPVFGNAWLRAYGKADCEQSGHPAVVYGCGVVLSVLSAAALQWLLGPNPELGRTLMVSLLLGLVVIGGAITINDQFAARPFTVTLIDGGYHAVRFLIMGGILAVWP